MSGFIYCQERQFDCSVTADTAVGVCAAPIVLKPEALSVGMCFSLTVENTQSAWRMIKRKLNGLYVTISDALLTFVRRKLLPVVRYCRIRRRMAAVRGLPVNKVGYLRL